MMTLNQDSLTVAPPCLDTGHLLRMQPVHPAVSQHDFQQGYQGMIQFHLFLFIDHTNSSFVKSVMMILLDSAGSL